MAKFIHYLGIAAIGFITVAAIGITLGASTMLACYLTTCGISHFQRAAIKEVREIEEEQQIRAQSSESEEEKPENRRTWADSGQKVEQTVSIPMPY